MQKASFDKNTTAALKGIALILMFVHHFFAYPEWYVGGVAYEQLLDHVRFFRYSMKICVPVFAFMTGYFYAFVRHKTLAYSLRKITDILISYWVVYFPVVAAVLITGCSKVSLFGFIQGCLGRNISIMTFCWYVSFYCLAMLLLPLLTRLARPHLLADVALLVILPTLGCTIAEALIGSNTLRTMIEEIRIWFPCVASGYLCAKYRVFEAMQACIAKKAGTVRILAYGLCICLAIAGRYVCDVFTFGHIHFLGRDWSLSCTLDMLYAPLFVWGTAMLLQYIKDGRVMKLLEAIGQQSLLMWFIHCIFFNVLNGYTQRILYWPKQPVLVVIFGLVLCYMLAWLISPVEKRLIRLKGVLLKRWL